MYFGDIQQSTHDCDLIINEELFEINEQLEINVVAHNYLLKNVTIISECRSFTVGWFLFMSVIWKSLL